MRILFFSPYFYPYTSGLTKYPLKILTHFAQTHDVTVLTFKHSEKLSTTETINNIKIVRMPYLFRVSKGFISPQSISYFYSFAKKTETILLNTPNFEGFPLAILGYLYNKKIISIFHCNVDLGKNIFSEILSLTLNASVFLQLSFSKVITAYADYVEYTWVGKRFSSKIQTVLPPVETYSVHSGSLKEYHALKKNSIAIAYVGRVSREKGLEYLIDAIGKLPSEIKKNCTLLFAGAYGKDVVGEENYFNKIKKHADNLKVDSHFLGFIPEEKLGALYKAIDLLVLPSINTTEAFGMVQAESMLIGTPVVATDLPGIRVPITLTRMGILAKPQDADNLAQAITQILETKNVYTNEKLINGAREIFNSEKVFTVYDKILKNV